MPKDFFSEPGSPPQLDPFSAAYQPKAIWFPSRNRQAPYERHFLTNFSIPEATMRALDQFVKRLEVPWTKATELIRVAIYHGLHHLAEINFHEELKEIAHLYGAALAFEHEIGLLDYRAHVIERAIELVDKVKTRAEAKRNLVTLSVHAAGQTDPEVKEKILEQLERLKGRM